MTENEAREPLNAKDIQSNHGAEPNFDGFHPQNSTSELKQLEAKLKADLVKAIQEGNPVVVMKKQYELRELPMQILAKESSEIAEELKQIDIEFENLKEDEAELISLQQEKQLKLIPLIDAVNDARRDVHRVEFSLFQVDESRKGLTERRKTLKERKTQIMREVRENGYN